MLIVCLSKMTVPISIILSNLSISIGVHFGSTVFVVNQLGRKDNWILVCIDMPPTAAISVFRPFLTNPTLPVDAHTRQVRKKIHFSVKHMNRITRLNLLWQNRLTWSIPSCLSSQYVPWKMAICRVRIRSFVSTSTSTMSPGGPLPVPTHAHTMTIK